MFKDCEVSSSERLVKLASTLYADAEKRFGSDLIYHDDIDGLRYADKLTLARAYVDTEWKRRRLDLQFGRTFMRYLCLR